MIKSISIKRVMSYVLVMAVLITGVTGCGKKKGSADVSTMSLS